MTAVDDIERLAKQLAKEALTEGNKDISFRDRLDALKVLAPYYTLLKKEKPADEDADGATMTDFAAAMQENTNAGAQVRGHRRRQ